MTTPTLSNSRMLTLPEVAAMLRCHRSTVYRLLRAGKLPGFKVFSVWRFRREDIDAWRFQTPPQ